MASLSRYFLGDWETIIQQSAREAGEVVRIVSADPRAIGDDPKQVLKTLRHRSNSAPGQSMWAGAAMSRGAYKRLMGVVGAIIAIELIAGLMEWRLMPASSCRNSLGGSALIVVGIGALMFGLTSAGTWWQGFLGRRLLGASQRRLDGLRDTNPTRTSRIDAIAKLFGGTQLTEAMWNHPWLTGLVGAAFGVVVFGGLFIVGAWIQPNSCGS